MRLLRRVPDGKLGHAVIPPEELRAMVQDAVEGHFFRELEAGSESQRRVAKIDPRMKFSKLLAPFPVYPNIG
jgi:hypothetical protein